MPQQRATISAEKVSAEKGSLADGRGASPERALEPRGVSTDRVSLGKTPREPFDDELPLSAAALAGVIAEGAQFGDYVVGPCIRQAEGMRLYRAEHRSVPGRPVALKLFTTLTSEDSERLARFLHYAKVAATLRHPSLVDVFDVGEHAGVPYLVRELLDGVDLEQHLGCMGSLSETEVADLVIPMAAGLSALHDTGVVHGDLRPSSVHLPATVDGHQYPKLLDFGIARVCEGADLRTASGTRGPWRGEPLYFSPEAVRGDELSATSDQFSLGVLMYEAVTGVNPFSAESFGEAVRRITSGQHPTLSEQLPSVSPRLAAVVGRAMAVSPSQRFPDMRCLGRELLELASEPTRVSWSLSFAGAAAAASEPDAARTFRYQAAASPSLSFQLGAAFRDLFGVAPWKDARGFEWGTALALVVGLVSFAWAFSLLF